MTPQPRLWDLTLLSLSCTHAASLQSLQSEPKDCQCHGQHQGPSLLPSVTHARWGVSVSPLRIGIHIFLGEPSQPPLLVHGICDLDVAQEIEPLAFCEDY